LRPQGRIDDVSQDHRTSSQHPESGWGLVGSREKSKTGQPIIGESRRRKYISKKISGI